MILKNALINAFATARYVIGVASLLFYAPHFAGSEEPVLIPIVVPLLVVFSALFTGCMMVGRPVLWYIEGKKKEALSLIVLTLAIFFIITALALLALFALRAAV